MKRRLERGEGDEVSGHPHVKSVMRLLSIFVDYAILNIYIYLLALKNRLEVSRQNRHRLVVGADVRFVQDRVRFGIRWRLCLFRLGYSCLWMCWYWFQIAS